MSSIEIVEYSTTLAPFFKSLNEEWLEKYFVVEPIDEKVLSNPQKYIIDEGGAILFAKLNNEVVGTVALKKAKGYTYEMTKMAVTQSAQGHQIGKKLALAIIEKAKAINVDLVFLESNRILTTALSLYQKIGFKEKVSPFEISDYQRADIYMELNLK